MTFLNNELERYSSQIKLNEIGLEGQRQLKQARVLCIGAGGLGSPLLIYLANAGIGCLGIIDDDRVELSNLPRQPLYQVKDIKQKKVFVAKEHLDGLSPGIQINTYAYRLTEDNAEELISQYDIVADCSDNFYTRYLIHELCYSLKKPYVYASVSEFRGYCSLFSENTLSCLECLFPKTLTPLPSCQESGILGLSPGFLGLIQGMEIIKWVLNMGQALSNRLLIVDLLAMKFEEIQLIKNPDCPLCSNDTKLRRPESPWSQGFVGHQS